MAAQTPDPATTNNSVTPFIILPTGDIAYAPGIIRIVWSHTLAGAVTASYYDLQVDTDVNFGSPLSTRIFQYQNVNFRDQSFTADIWYIRVKTTEHTGDPEEPIIVVSPWSPVKQILVDVNVGQGDIVNILRGNENKFVPIAYGKYDDLTKDNHDISNGLMIGYLGDFAPNPLYFFASHSTTATTSGGENFALHVPITEGVLMSPLDTPSVSLFWPGDYPSIGGSGVALVDNSNGVYLLAKEFSLSNDPLSAPFVSSNSYTASNRDNVTDDDALTLATLKVLNEQKITTTNPDYWSMTSVSAWEINDPLRELPKIMNTAGAEMWCHYRNLHPARIEEGTYGTVFDDDLIITPKLTLWVNPNNLSLSQRLKIGEAIPTFNFNRFDILTWEPNGPLLASTVKAANPDNTRYKFSLEIVADSRTNGGSSTPAGNAGTIGDLKLSTKFNLNFKQLSDILTVYVSGGGRFYEDWILLDRKNNPVT